MPFDQSEVYGVYKVYQLSTKHTDKIYIGSTKLPLLRRYRVHRTQHRYPLRHGTCSSAVLFAYGEEDVKIKLLATAANQEEARKIERFYVESSNTCNINVPNRGPRERYLLRGRVPRRCDLCGTRVTTAFMTRHQRSIKCLELRKLQSQTLVQDFIDAISDSTDGGGQVPPVQSAQEGICQTNL